MKLLDLSRYDEYLPSWKTLYFDEVRPIINLQNILRQVFICDEKYYPLLLSYLCVNSAIAKQLPILFVYGRKGSGKSTLGYFASKLWGTTVHTSADTVAAIRTHLDSARVAYAENLHKTAPKDSSYVKVEKHTGLILDDIDDRTFFEKPDLYRMFKCG